MSKLVLNSFHEPLLPIGTILTYKTLEVEIIGYDGYHDGFADSYIIQLVGGVSLLSTNDEDLEVV